MMQVLITGLLLFFGFTSGAQVYKYGHPCGGMDILAAGVHIQGHEVLDYNGIRYSEISAESLRKGFTVILADSSYRVNWFYINYESKSGVKEYPISTAKVGVKNADFLICVEAGDRFSIECINITKKNVTSLSTSFDVIVTK